MKYMKQRSKSDCGVACLQMIAWYHGKRLPYTELFNEVEADRSGCSVYGICTAARRYQLEPTVYQGTADSLIGDIRSRKIHLPIIARVVNRFQQAHFIVISTVLKDRVKILDPDESIGRTTVPLAFFKGIFLGDVIGFAKQEGFRRENRYVNPLRKFIRCAASQKLPILSSAILSVIISGIGILSSLVLRYLVDDVFQAQTEHAMEEGVEMFALLISGMSLLFIIRFFLQLIRGRLSAKLIGTIHYNLITGVYHKMIDLPLKYFNTRETGDLMSRFSDASKINQAIASLVLAVGLDLIMILGSGIAIRHLSHNLFRYALIIALTYAIISLLYIRPLECANRAVITAGASINSYLKETTDDICTVKACNADAVVKTKFSALFSNFRDLVIKASMKNTMKCGFIEVVGSIGTLAFLWGGCMHVISGTLTAGTLIGIYTLLGFFTSPIQSMIELQSSLQEACIAAERLEDIYDSAPEQRGTPGKVPENGDVVFDRVSFRYPNADPILNELSFHIPDGKVAAVIGASGCGKSTAGRLMARIYDPVRGRICIGGQNIADMALDDLRSQVVYIPQEVSFFSDSLRNNLTFGLTREVSDEELRQTLELCDCGFIEERGMTLDSLVEEGGVNFSGGQCKRLAIARALLRDPKVLILDETIANLSEDSVRSITERINALPCTKIWITHNSNQITGLDIIIDLNRNESAASPSFELKAAALA